MMVNIVILFLYIDDICFSFIFSLDFGDFIIEGENEIVIFFIRKLFNVLCCNFLLELIE